MIAYLLPTFARSYPGLKIGVPYLVTRLDAHVDGFFLRVGKREQFVFAEHFQAEDDDTSLPARNDDLHTLADPLVQRIKHCVRPIFIHEDGRVPDHIGCGLLLSLAGVRFLLSAAHVLRQGRDRTLTIGSVDRLASLVGRSEYSEPPNGFSPYNDPLDVGVVRVADDCVPELDGSALHLPDLDYEEQDTHSNYLFLGYPTNRLKTNPSVRHVAPDLVRYIGSGAETDQYILPRHPLTHVAVDFDQQASVTAEGIRPITSPAGSSGTGLWRLDPLPGLPGDPTLTLVAIFTDYLHSERLLVGTRIVYHLALIRDRWPDLAPQIPELPYDLRFQSQQERGPGQDQAPGA